jgi:glutamine synthetase
VLAAKVLYARAADRYNRRQHLLRYEGHITALTINLNMKELSDAELAARGVRSLPRTLLEAVEAFAADPLRKTVLGNDLRRAFIAVKQREWWSYHSTVSKWEYDNYLTKF